MRRCWNWGIAPPVRSIPSLLYITDFSYPARGRRYCDEDIFLTGRLRHDFHLACCHPKDAANLLVRFDGAVVRNSGPVMGYQAEYSVFREHALASGTRIYNPLTGKADMAGKQYILELFAAGFPVIPTVDRLEDLPQLPKVNRYVV